MDFRRIFKQVVILLLLIAPSLIILGLMILSLKSDTESLKGQVSTLQEFIDSQHLWNGGQFEWNQTSTKVDSLMLNRVQVLEQKMRKLYQDYDVKPAKFYDVDSLYLQPKLGEIIIINGLGEPVVYLLPNWKDIIEN